MRAVVQRVTRASVSVDSELIGSIDAGLCVLVGVGREDVEFDARWLAKKVVGLRIFEDEDGKMNCPLSDLPEPALLAVSQFTLLGDVRKGKRPSFIAAMEPEAARELFELFCSEARDLGVQVATGRFRANMAVDLCNDGPVTMLVDSKKLF